MNDQQLLRYSRHILLPEIDLDGQDQLLASTALIIGLGGLGSPVALYLAAAGVGHLVLVDDDRVDLGNLQRQIAHTTDRIGVDKVQSASESLLALNPDVRITPINHRLSGEELEQQVRSAQVVLDCSDNFLTRFALNKACLNAQVPLVSGAAIRWEGQVSVYDFRDANSPCYQCLYDPDVNTDDSCSRNGVVAPLVGVIGSMQALEAIKLLMGKPSKLCGKLALYDGWQSQWRELRLHKDVECACCSIPKR